MLWEKDEHGSLHARHGRFIYSVLDAALRIDHLLGKYAVSRCFADWDWYMEQDEDDAVNFDWIGYDGYINPLDGQTQFGFGVALASGFPEWMLFNTIEEATAFAEREAATFQAFVDEKNATVR